MDSTGVLKRTSSVALATSSRMPSSHVVVTLEEPWAADLRGRRRLKRSRAKIQNLKSKMAKRLLLTGLDLTRNDFYEVVLKNRPVGLHPDARRAMASSRALIDRMIAERKVVYAVTTGVGSLSTERIEPDRARELQLNIVRSHACGVGEPLGAAETRGLLLLRANGLARGLSGVRPAVAERLCEFLNRGVHPVVPSRGSVGASGDLAPLAHVALA